MGDTRNWYFRVHEKFFSDKEIRKIELLPQSRYGIHLFVETWVVVSLQC